MEPDEHVEKGLAGPEQMRKTSRKFSQARKIIVVTPGLPASGRSESLRIKLGKQNGNVREMAEHITAKSAAYWQAAEHWLLAQGSILITWWSALWER